MRYFNSKYGDLPDPTIIEDNLTPREAQEKEEFYIKFFSERGFTTLNKAKAGSLGGRVIIWNEESCIIEARKYKSLKDFYENSSGAYQAAYKNGWINSYTWLKRRNKWTDETVLNEARKYNSRSEFMKEKPGACEYAIRHKLPLDEIFTTK